MQHLGDIIKSFLGSVLVVLLGYFNIGSYLSLSQQYYYPIKLNLLNLFLSTINLQSLF